MKTVITCRISDWLEYRYQNIGALEVDCVKIKIYEGVFNLSWEWLKDSDKLESFFSKCDSIITHVDGNKVKTIGYNNYDDLILYAPSIGNDNKIVYTEREVG